MLTKQQQKLLVFIKGFQEENGISPSFDEMRCALNQKSKSGIHMLLNGLVERGFVRRLTNRARAIEIIKFIETTPTLKVQEPISSNPIHTKDADPMKGIERSTVDLSSYGIQNTIFPANVFLGGPEKIISLSKDSFPYVLGQDYCVVQLGGDSLKEMAIINDDILIFKMTEEAMPGQLVLAVVDDENVHMKRWEMKDGKIILSLGNKYMMPQVYDTDRVRIKGVLVGLIRKYMSL